MFIKLLDLQIFQKVKNTPKKKKNLKTEIEERLMIGTSWRTIMRNE